MPFFTGIAREIRRAFVSVVGVAMMKGGMKAFGLSKEDFLLDARNQRGFEEVKTRPIRGTLAASEKNTRLNGAMYLAVNNY